MRKILSILLLVPFVSLAQHNGPYPGGGGGGGGASQTPWIGDINGAQHNLTNVTSVTATTLNATNAAGIMSSFFSTTAAGDIVVNGTGPLQGSLSISTNQSFSLDGFFINILGGGTSARFNGASITNISAWNIVGATTNNAVVRYFAADANNVGNYFVSNSVSGNTIEVQTNMAVFINGQLVLTNAYYTNTTTILPDGKGNLAVGTNNLSGSGGGNAFTNNANPQIFSGQQVLTNANNLMAGVWVFNGTTTNYVVGGIVCLSNTASTTLISSFDTGNGNSTNAGTTWSGLFVGNAAGITNASLCYYTNLVNGQLYTNPLTVTMQLTIPVVVSSPATTLGSAEIDAKTGPKGGTLITVADLDIAGGATSILLTNKDVLVINVPSGWTWETTNNISGANYVAGYDAGKTNQVLIIP